MSFAGTGSPDDGETERGGNGGSGSSLLALMWPSFESKRNGKEEMCFASEKKRGKKKGKKQHLALKCSFSRELVAFTEVRSASQERMRAAYLAGTHIHTHTEQVDSADSREASLASLLCAAQLCRGFRVASLCTSETG